MTEQASAVLAVAVAVVILLVWALPIVLLGRAMGSVDLFVPGAIGLVLGLFLRSRSTPRLQRRGSILIVVGLAATVVAGVVIWLLLNGLGRPF